MDHIFSDSGSIDFAGCVLKTEYFFIVVLRMDFYVEEITQTHLGRIRIGNDIELIFDDCANDFLDRCEIAEEFCSYYLRENRIKITDMYESFKYALKKKSAKLMRILFEVTNPKIHMFVGIKDQDKRPRWCFKIFYVDGSMTYITCTDDMDEFLRTNYKFFRNDTFVHFPFADLHLNNLWNKMNAEQ